MSYLLPHLRSGWAVDQAILSEEDRVVCIRFGSDADDTCMRMDEVRFPPLSKLRTVHRTDHPFSMQMLAGCAEKIKNFAIVYLVDITEVRRLRVCSCARTCVLSYFSACGLTALRSHTGARLQRDV